MREDFSYFRLEPYVKPASIAFEARVGIRRTDSSLKLIYEVAGPIDELVVPEVGGLRGEELWNHTCFELFVRGADDASYWEWNFSPTGRINFFGFSAYRKRLDPVHAGDGGVRVLRITEHTGSRLVVEVEVSAPPSEILRWQLLSKAPLRLGATAVLETKSAGLQYLSARHSGPKPDFHRTEDMIIVL